MPRSVRRCFVLSVHVVRCLMLLSLTRVLPSLCTSINNRIYERHSVPCCSRWRGGVLVAGDLAGSDRAHRDRPALRNGAYNQGPGAAVPRPQAAVGRAAPVGRPPFHAGGPARRPTAPGRSSGSGSGSAAPSHARALPASLGRLGTPGQRPGVPRGLLVHGVRAASPSRGRRLWCGPKLALFSRGTTSRWDAAVSRGSLPSTFRAHRRPAHGSVVVCLDQDALIRMPGSSVLRGHPRGSSSRRPTNLRNLERRSQHTSRRTVQLAFDQSHPMASPSAIQEYPEQQGCEQRPRSRLCCCNSSPTHGLSATGCDPGENGKLSVYMIRVSRDSFAGSRPSRASTGPMRSAPRNRWPCRSRTRSCRIRIQRGLPASTAASSKRTRMAIISARRLIVRQAAVAARPAFC